VPKGYWITWYHSDVDASVHPKYAELAGKAIESFGGRFLARGVPVATYEGGFGHRCVVVEFNSAADATAAYESASYRAALDVLGKSAKREVRIVEGQ
jgi:uncharacterized protein (DUF1330 family)